MNRHNAVRLLLLTGVAGPCIFAAAVIIGGALRADYSHVDQFISELGESGSNFAWVMNYFGFMLAASLILIFVFTFRTRFPKTLTNAIGTLLLAIFAVSVFLAGVYSCDVGCPPIDRTPEQKLHDVVSIVAFPAFILGVVTWGISFYRKVGWKSSESIRR